MAVPSSVLPRRADDAIGPDERAFLELVERHHVLMVRVAQGYVPSRAVAEEVAQETWLGVLKGLDAFQGRSTLKTWIFSILVNRAKTRGERESRTTPLSALESERWDEAPAVDPARFARASRGSRSGHWAEPPQRWDELPEERLLARETLARAREAVDELPPRQREVVLLRDVDGWAADEVCDALGLSQGNQRVLLHRARSHVRAALERYLVDEERPRALA